jgi:lipoate-protein ligase A
VLVAPGGQIWLNVFVPVGDPLWSDDVGRASWWLADMWARLLQEAGVSGSEIVVHRDAGGRGAGATSRPHTGLAGSGGVAGADGGGRRWSKLLCFAGVGSGEVLVRGLKVLGISQRRDRHGGWFHSSLLLRLDADRLVSVLALDEATRRDAAEALRSTSAAAGVDPSIVTARLASVLAASDDVAGEGSGAGLGERSG